MQVSVILSHGARQFGVPHLYKLSKQPTAKRSLSSPLAPSASIQVLGHLELPLGWLAFASALPPDSLHTVARAICECQF